MTKFFHAEGVQSYGWSADGVNIASTITDGYKAAIGRRIEVLIGRSFEEAREVALHILSIAYKMENKDKFPHYADFKYRWENGQIILQERKVGSGVYTDVEPDE